MEGASLHGARSLVHRVQAHQETRSQVTAGPVEAFDIDDDGRVFMDDLDTFNDPLAEPPAAGAALAAAAAAALARAAGAAGGSG